MERGAVGEWLRRIPAWQFALIWGLAMATGSGLGGVLGQLWKHHLDGPELLGMAAGSALAGSFAATAVRWHQRESSKLTPDTPHHGEHDSDLDRR